jgi:uridine kinase
MNKTNPSRHTTTRVKPLLVAIAGGSGAGKSWLARQIRDALGHRIADIVSLDEFYRDQSHLTATRRARLNFDNPSAIDWPALEAATDCWLAGKSAKIPRYDFSTHCRRVSSRVVSPKAILLIEGLWLFRRRSLRNKFALRIFIECGHQCRLERRIARDCKQRGRSAESVRKQFRTTVEPMHAKFVEPQKHWANLVLDGKLGRRELRQVVELVGLLRRRAYSPPFRFKWKPATRNLFKSLHVHKTACPDRTAAP